MHCPNGQWMLKTIRYHSTEVKERPGEDLDVEMHAAIIFMMSIGLSSQVIRGYQSDEECRRVISGLVKMTVLDYPII